MTAEQKTETVHTCSYECERPECIRAQRDELVARLTTPPSAPVGVEDVVMAARNAENAIRNCAAAGQIGEGYVQYADDLRDAVQRLTQQHAAVDGSDAQAAEIETLLAELDIRDSIIATHAADTREYQKRISQAEARAERLAEALQLAEEHIGALTPEWYSAGQRVLAAIRVALEQEPKL